MVSLLLTWTGLVLGVSLLLVMALGPLIVQVDSYFYERNHERQAVAERVNVQP